MTGSGRKREREGLSAAGAYGPVASDAAHMGGKRRKSKGIRGVGAARRSWMSTRELHPEWNIRRTKRLHGPAVGHKRVSEAMP
jgi:hypothetical protein